MDKKEEQTGLSVQADQPSGLQKETQQGSTNRIFGQVVLTRTIMDREERHAFTLSHSKSKVFIGRSIDLCGADGIVFANEDISEKHAMIFCQDGVFYIEDLGATNGTFVEGRRLDSKERVVLSPKCEISLATVVLQCRIHGGSSMTQRSSDVVIAEFDLINLDAPGNSSRHCEIFSDRLQFLIGRAAHCDYRISFKDRYVADEQAKIIYSPQEEMYIIRNLVQDNPICVNSQRVPGDRHLKSGDIIKLGIAPGAPKLRFSIQGESIQQQEETRGLSEFIKVLARGKSYEIGNAESCQIRVEHPALVGTIAWLSVPEEGEHLLLRKDPNANVQISIDNAEVHVNENRVLQLQQNLRLGNCLNLIHDHCEFVIPRTPRQYLFSDCVAIPQRGKIYSVGSVVSATFPTNDESAPAKIVEIEVPLEGDHFFVSRCSGVDVDVFIDNVPIHGRTRYGVSQTLKIGDFVEIRNNHRSLPPAASSNLLRRIVVGTFMCLLLGAIGVGIFVLAQNSSDWWEHLKSGQNLMKTYQKNVFYIVAFDKQMKHISSGTGFLLPQKGAYEEDIYYIVTSKHVVEPWKFEPHLRQGTENFTKDGEKIEDYYIAVWPYNTQAIDVESQKRLYQNSFHNLPLQEKLGDVILFRAGIDELNENGKLSEHQKRSNEDLAVLKLIPKKGWKYPYQPWSTIRESQIDVGEAVIVLGYSLGGGRLLNKNGIVVPAVCDGKLSSDCKFPDFLELNVNQTQGSSGGPIINFRGEIVGIVAFMDHEKNLLYGIHAKKLEQLMK